MAEKHPHEPEPPEEIRHADGRIEHPRVRREARDVSFTWVLAVILVAIVIGAANFYFIWLFFNNREQHQQTQKLSTYPLAPQSGLTVPVGPRLEQLYRLEGEQEKSVYQLEAAAQKRINSYGPTDEKGFVHIPIRDAMKLVAPQLPVRKQSADDTSSKNNGLLYGGAPNSGRIFRGESQ